MYYKRDKSDVLKDLRVVHKEKKMVNRVHRWCIVLCHGNSKVKELYAVEQWFKVVVEGPGIAYFPINSPLINDANNIEVPLK